MKYILAIEPICWTRHLDTAGNYSWETQIVIHIAWWYMPVLFCRAVIQRKTMAEVLREGHKEIEKSLAVWNDDYLERILKRLRKDDDNEVSV